MEQKDSLLQKCLEHLKALPDIRATLNQEYVLDSGGSDGLLTIHSPLQSVNYSYAIVPNITGTTAELVIAYLQRFEEKVGQKLLLVSHYLPNPAIDRFLAKNVEFIDTAGNIYLNNPAAYVLIRGKPQPKEKLSSGSKITITTLELIYILLKSPNLLEATYRELASSAGVALGSVATTLKNLDKLGYLQRKREGGYRITNYIKLLERWEMGYAESLRPKLLLGTFTPASGRKFSEVAPNIVSLAKAEGFLIGGELGAQAATSYLHSQRATLHVLDNHRLIATKLKLKPSPQGEIIFLQQFGTQNACTDLQGEFIADPLLIHAELLMENNDRLRETAERLFAKYIEDRQKNA